MSLGVAENDMWGEYSFVAQCVLYRLESKNQKHTTPKTLKSAINYCFGNGSVKLIRKNGRMKELNLLVSKIQQLGKRD